MAEMNNPCMICNSDLVSCYYDLQSSELVWSKNMNYYNDIYKCISVKNMTENTDNKYALSCKKVWMIYALIIIIIMIILAIFVARDNEERLFYSLMTAAASYVFRPTDRVINKYVLRLFGVSPPKEPDADNWFSKRTLSRPGHSLVRYKWSIIWAIIKLSHFLLRLFKNET